MSSAVTTTRASVPGGPASLSLLSSSIRALRDASPGLPSKPSVLVVGSPDDALLAKVLQFAPSSTVMRADPSVAPAAFSVPGGAVSGPFDLVVACSLLNGPRDPSAWIDRLRGLAPLIWANVAVVGDGGRPLPLMLDGPYPLPAPPRALAIDRFVRLGLVCRVVAEARGSDVSSLIVSCERMPPVTPPSSPLLVHVHVPKNGGMTVTSTLERSFGRRHLSLYLEDPADEQTPHRVRAALHEHRDVRAISSHSFHQFPPEIGGRAALYFTLLRDPADRIMSYMRYCQKNWESLSEEHRRGLPEGFREMGVLDYIRWQSSRLEAGGGISSNLQCQYFARPNNLRMAQRVLRDFFFVGLTDRMALSLAVLRAKLRDWGVELAEPAAERANTTKDYYQRTALETDNPEVREFLARLGDDRQLVRWASQRLTAEAEQLGVQDPDEGAA